VPREWTDGKEEVMEISELKALSKKFRIQVLKMFMNAGSGHFGGSFSAVEILVALYFGGILNVDPKRPLWEDRDRLVLSKGHASGMLCAILAEKGFYPKELLDTYNHLNSPFGQHPDMNKIPGIDMSTGSLGHGLSVAVGMALAARMDKRSYRCFAILGDAEIQSGMTYEAAMAAGNYGLDSLVMILDRNLYTMDGSSEDLMSIEPIQDKLKSLKWAVTTIDGHDYGQILKALQRLPIEPGKPSAIIANTVKGKGVSFMENTHAWHFKPLEQEPFQRALQELEADKS
jgi:transketolase